MEQKVVSASVYGFVSWLLSFVTLICFVMWQFLGDRILSSMGITYLPLKYWGIVVCLGIPFLSPVYPFSLFALALRNNLPLESPAYIGENEGRPFILPETQRESELASTGDLRCDYVRNLIRNRVQKEYLAPLKASRPRTRSPVAQ